MVRAKPRLSRREQEVLDIVFARGHATAAEVREAMHEAPTDAAVRTTLRILVAKGHLRIEQDGPRYDYWPTVVTTGGAAFGAAARAAHVLWRLDRKRAGDAARHPPDELDDEARQRLKRLIDDSAKEGR